MFNFNRASKRVESFEVQEKKSVEETLAEKGLEKLQNENPSLSLEYIRKKWRSPMYVAAMLTALSGTGSAFANTVHYNSENDNSNIPETNNFSEFDSSNLNDTLGDLDLKIPSELSNGLGLNIGENEVNKPDFFVQENEEWSNPQESVIAISSDHKYDGWKDNDGRYSAFNESNSGVVTSTERGNEKFSVVDYSNSFGNNERAFMYSRNLLTHGGFYAGASIGIDDKEVLNNGNAERMVLPVGNAFVGYKNTIDYGNTKISYGIEIGGSPQISLEKDGDPKSAVNIPGIQYNAASIRIDMP